MKKGILFIAVSIVASFLVCAQPTDNNKREGDRADPAINPIFNYYEWENELPANCPFDKSKDFEKIIFTGRYANYTGADTWYLQSGPDGNLYSCWTDGSIGGFSTNSNIRSQSVGQAKITGNDPLNLKFENLGRMWSGGANYYPCVSLIVDSTFFIGTFSAFNDEGYFNGFRYSQNWDHFTANTEPDWRNPFWINAIDNDGNFFNERGKAKFRVLHSVNFAKNNKAPDGRVYFSAHGYSSGNGKNNWDKGDAIYLCRTLAHPDSIICSNSYEFYAGNKTNGNPLWKKRVENAEPVLDWPNHLGSEGITYFPNLNKYILMTCRLKENEDNLPYNVTIFWESEKITGPYTIIHYMKDWGAQTYFPNIPSQFINGDGLSAWMTVACNYSVQNINPHQCRYSASMHEISIIPRDRSVVKLHNAQRNIAQQARVWASSFEPECKPEKVIDGFIDIENKKEVNEWISLEGEGAMIKLEWDQKKTINKIRVYDSPDPKRWTQEGYFVFSDGSMEWMYAAPSNSANTPAEINFDPKNVKWVKFSITKGVAGISTLTNIEPGQRLGLAEIEVFEVE